MARPELCLEVDLEAFLRIVDKHLIADVQAAMVEGLNAAGEAGVCAVWKGHGAAGPVRDLLRRLREGRGQHLGDRLGRLGRNAERARLVAEQTVDARLALAPLPAAHGRAAEARLSGHSLDRQLDLFERL